MKPKFKKGDKVKLIKYIKLHENYGGLYFFDYMKFETGTIRHVTGIGTFTIEENPYYYAPEMLTKIK